MYCTCKLCGKRTFILMYRKFKHVSVSKKQNYLNTHAVHNISTFTHVHVHVIVADERRQVTVLSIREFTKK